MLEDKQITTREVQYLLSCSRSYIDKLIKLNKLRPWKEGNKLKFSYREVLAYIEEKKSERQRDLRNYTVTYLNFGLDIQ